MIVTAVKTLPIHSGDDLFSILDRFCPVLEENSVVAITSKIISLCQKRVVKIEPGVDKKKLIHEESDYYLTHEAMPKYGFITTITEDILIANAGVDESNGDGYYVLWPKDIQYVTNKIWTYLKNKNAIKNLGIIVTDSHSTMLRWGVTGICLSWCGFLPLKSYINSPDIFGRHFNSVNTSVIDGLAASAVYTMGEGNEQTPLAVISDIPHIQFVDHEPTHDELKSLKISLEDDLYAPLLSSVTWIKGGRKA